MSLAQVPSSLPINKLLVQTSILWDTAPSSSVKIRRSYGGIYLHPQSRRVSQTRYHHEAGCKRNSLCWLLASWCFLVIGVMSQKTQLNWTQLNSQLSSQLSTQLNSQLSTQLKLNSTHLISTQLISSHLSSTQLNLAQFNSHFTSMVGSWGQGFRGSFKKNSIIRWAAMNTSKIQAVMTTNV
jgi:hypothetical protein